MMKAILIDDEQLALDLLERNLNNIGSIEVIGTHTDPMEGKKDILQKDVDIIFLDIHLPEVNGMELAEQIIEKKPYLPIIFVTAFNEYAVKAFELNALDYISGMRFAIYTPIFEPNMTPIPPKKTTNQSIFA